ncbi:Obscurin [Labeo rohita]|uniref:Obscurin n=1 Tax=Labeo rohita TaxID=84645 RepID=A0ABQ8MWE3_LABRO|nr:Obscurin [Labeo rohita]
MNTHPEKWAAIAPAPGEQLGVQCLAQGHFSHGIEGGKSAVYSQFLLNTRPHKDPAAFHVDTDQEAQQSSFSQFLDFALLSVGSSFTVGVTEKERDITIMAAAKFSQPQALGHTCILIATPVIQPARESAATAERAHIMEATADCQLKLQLIFLSQVKSQLIFQSHVTSQLIIQSLFTFQLIFQSLVVSAIPRSWKSVLKYLRLASSMEDPPLVSVSGIPKPSLSTPPVPELIPPSAALSIMGIALRCVWAMYTTTESPEKAACAPDPPEAAVSAAVSSEATMPTTVPPEVPAYTAEPQEMATSASALCKVVAPSDTPPARELSSCSEPAMEAVSELPVCLVMAMEATSEFPVCPVPATEAIFELSFCPEPAMEAGYERHAQRDR